MKKMRIVLITPYWLQTKGGITATVFNLSNKLKQMGYLSWVLSPDNGEGIIKLPKNRLMMVGRTIKVLREINPDVIHVHSHGSLLLAPVIYKSLINIQVKIIFTFHTQPRTVSFFTGKPIKERGVVGQVIFNYLLRNCNATTYISRSLMESLRKTGIKIINPVIIPTGVIKETVSPEEIIEFRRKFNLENSYPVLCMIANLSWDWKAKGVQILIDAFRKVLIFQQRAKLFIIGDGQYRKKLEYYAKKEGLEKQITFTGRVKNQFVGLSACDIYCHISLNESYGLASLEAMITGKPVIVSNDGGLPEIITDGIDGILVVSNPDSVAKAILTLLENQNLMQDLSKNAIITATSKFSWERAVLKYQKLYETV